MSDLTREEIQRDESELMNNSTVGGPGGSSLRGLRMSSSGLGSRPSGGSGPGGLRAPSQADRPMRKGSVSAGGDGARGTPVLPPQTPPSAPVVDPFPQVSAAPTAVPTNNLPTYAPLPPQQYAPPPKPQQVHQTFFPATQPYGHAMPAVAPQQGSTHLQSYQTNLANNMNTSALLALQREQDPLLEAMDPFLGRNTGYRPPSDPVTQQLTRNDLAHLGNDDLHRLVSSYNSRNPGEVSMHPEKVDVSPPRTPPMRPNGLRDPAAIVAEVENKELARAARDLLNEKLDGLDIRRKALENYYNTNQDIAFGDYAKHGGDPVRAAHLQRAAKLDPFIKNTNLGIPTAVDPTRVPVGSVHRGHLEEGRTYLGNTEFIVRDIADDGYDMEVEDEGPVKQVAPQAIHGSAKSLLVGIGYRGTPHEITESTMKVDRMKAYLLEQGFFGQQLALCDDLPSPEAQPNHTNILTAVRWLVEDARPGQCLFFYYCGRAQPSLEGGDGSDLLPSDFEQTGPIPNSTVTAIVTALPPGVKLTLLIDCFPSGQAISLPFKMFANPDNSFRVTEGHTNSASAHIVQISTMRDTPMQGPEPPSNITHGFVTATAGNRTPTYRRLMLSLKGAMTSDQYTACISTNRPVDFKKAVFHLGAPESSGEDDPRLCEAKERTRTLARDLGLAHEDAIAAAAANNEKMMQQREEERKEADERRKKLEEMMDDMRRRATLESVETQLREIFRSEKAQRDRMKDEEATLRHNLVRLKHVEEQRTLADAIHGTGWSRIPAGEGTGMPIVVGVKWQKPSERPPQLTQAQKALNPSTGRVTRHFEVVPPTHTSPRDWDMQSSAPVTPHNNPSQQPRFPQDPSKVVKWKRVQANPNETPQWIREEFTDEAGTPQPIPRTPYP
eukprot:TRINITY_DN3946_c0_g1_i1.p1 TRINITY_DN3946_c0_g1~~TRINITY_DN3946_c0_g1_i1.p1  ORF type:complete len:893 (+),score=177.84 TRINITY_DN3946_c0_g1_i1:101-2779(+)